MRALAAAAAAVAMLAATASTASAANPAKVVAELRLGPNRVDLTIQTPAFAAPTHVQVMLPAGYDTQPNRRWPVTYYVVGARGTDLFGHPVGASRRFRLGR